MATGQPITYFGYGSLVTSETRPAHTRAFPATLSGWVRQWKHCAVSSFGKVCALTAARRPESAIDGVVILDDSVSIQVTDPREAGYFRERIELSDKRLPPEFRAAPLFIYVSAPPNCRWGDERYPILRSYLDCVLAGFLREFGQDGAERFMASTEGWDRVPILDDRQAPEYPRSVRLSYAESQQIEDLLTQRAIVMAGRSRRELGVLVGR